MKTPIADVVASAEVVLEQQPGVGTKLGIVIGRPYVVSDDEARCPVRIDGLEPQYSDICGSDTLQALCLAISLVRRRLEDQLGAGARLLSADGTAYDDRTLAALFGGARPGGSAG